VNVGLDINKMRSLLKSRRETIQLQTYDDVYERLEFFRSNMYSYYENLPGASIHISTEIFEVIGENNFILDIGITPDSNRVSMFVDTTGALILQVIDTFGMITRTSIDNFEYGDLIYAVAEVGHSSGKSVVSLQIQGGGVRRSLLSRLDIDLDLDKSFYFVIGSDLCGQEPTNMRLFEQCVYNRTLTFSERLQLQCYFDEKHSSDRGPHVQFYGHQALGSNPHPTFGSGFMIPAAPTYRDGKAAMSRQPYKA
jgi:hypothetical protein